MSMKITQFRKMLEVNGTDFTRWDADAAQARAFMKASPEAQGLYDEAEALERALDSFAVDAADPALLDKAMVRIGGKPEAAATVHRLEPRKQKPVFARPLYWGGAMAACAAAIVLFVSVTGGGPVAPSDPQQPAAVVAEAAPAEVDTLLAELDTMAEEEIAAQEIIGLLELADARMPAKQGPLSDEDIDAFLEELFSGEMEPAEPADEMDLWDLFLEGDIREL